MDIKELYKLFSKKRLISTDTRNITPGSVFFALKGDRFDGNDFLEIALQKGASYAITDRKGPIKNDRIIYVDDALASLQALASIHRKELNCTVIAITGSNGKTTTKELAFQVLRQKYNTSSTEGNLNNHIGVPLTLLSITGKTEFAVVEMGANHPGEIASLCRIALPDYGLITSIGKAHLEGFGSFEGVIRAKGELFDFIKNNNGKIFINNNNEILKNIGTGVGQITYGRSQDCFCSGNSLDQAPFLKVGYRWNSRDYAIQTRLTGNYNTENVLAAVCIGLYFNVEPEKINAAIENYIPANNRSQVIRTKTNTVILDAYNANPTSMRASIESFLGFPGENKVLILGDMFELGDDSEKEHRELAVYIHDLPFAQILLTGHMFAKTTDMAGVKTYGTVDDLNKWLSDHPIRNAIILVKGSRKMQLENILKIL